ncbi:MAG: hypothetical protein LBR38_02805 [Synergistaceae bacterium]|jgi:hypothetical protein|nr:hypothetical protein [Synergistaceae bacterium]
MPFAKALFALLLLALLPSRGLGGLAPPPKLDVLVTSPWLAIVTSFVGGVNVSVRSVQEWNADGDLTRRIRARALQDMPPDTLIIAFDDRDARSVGLPLEKYINYHRLYDLMPIDESRVDSFMSDPSVLPFIAQRVLTALADWDPNGYPYYQRRLAEFQARLYSSTLAGRQILKDKPVYDLTGHSWAMLCAAGCDVVRPSPEDWAAWSTWHGLDRLLSEVARLTEAKFTVVIDCSSPRSIRAYLAAKPAVFTLARPVGDYTTFLHDQYLALWSKMSERPLPPRGARRSY